MKVKNLLVYTMAGLLLIGANGCGSSEKSSTSQLTGSVTASGSSAILPLAKAAANDFKTKYPDVSVTINGGGSGTGLKQVSDGTVDIGNSDVFAHEKLSKEKAAELTDHKIAVITMAIVANKAVTEKVQSLTKEQVKEIFSGQITNWSQVNGPDEKIVLISRPTTSGTRALFVKYALDGTAEATNKSLETDDSGTLLQSVADNKGAVGYVALSYLGSYLEKNNSVGAIALNGVLPTLENTYNGTYPIWGYEHMYTKGAPTPAVKSYLDYVMSGEFGTRLEKMGYGVSSKMQTTRNE